MTHNINYKVLYSYLDVSSIIKATLNMANLIDQAHQLLIILIAAPEAIVALAVIAKNQKAKMADRQKAVSSLFKIACFYNHPMGAKAREVFRSFFE